MPRKERKTPEELEQEMIDRFDSRVYRECLLEGCWPDVDVLWPRVGHGMPEKMYRVMVEFGRRKKPMVNPKEEITLSDETWELVSRRAKEGCASCAYIAGDFKINAKLTDYPGNYPVEAKVSHVEAEKKGEVA